MASNHQPDLDRIVQDPEIMVGKPVVRGTRIPVERIIAHLANNPDLDDLFAAYPRLTVEDVRAALAFAHEAVQRSGKPARRAVPVGAGAAGA